MTPIICVYPAICQGVSRPKVAPEWPIVGARKPSVITCVLMLHERGYLQNVLTIVARGPSLNAPRFKKN